jgi:thiopurine S-methyltransferase
MSEDWLARWREGSIGFHEGRPNELLDRHHARLAGARRVLVPLCGKSVDLAFLAAHGHDVVGVELADQAVHQFFEEHALRPEVTARDPLIEYRAGALTVFAGDLFAATPAVIGAVDALYDRAALIALPAELRPRYVALVRGLLAPGARGLVITAEYDQSRMTGPPFSVLETELRTLYAGATVELVEDQPLRGVGKCAQTGTPATERCFFVRLDEPG